jgi:BrxA
MSTGSVEEGLISEKTAKGYTVTNFIKSSGLLADVSLLLSAWDESRSVEDNLDAAIRQNLFGKASRKRTADILRVFRQRYLPQDGSDRAFRIFVGSSLPSEITDRVIYYYTALAEPLLYDFVTDYLYPRYSRSERTITIRNAQEFITEGIRGGKTEGKWESENTRERVAQGLLSTLRDFGLLAGANRSPAKMLAPARLHVLAFAFIAFHMKRNEPSGLRILNNRAWRLFLFSLHDVEGYFAEADAEKLLTYQAAGSTIRIEFPTNDFEEYARALIERAV